MLSLFPYSPSGSFHLMRCMLLSTLIRDSCFAHQHYSLPETYLWSYVLIAYHYLCYLKGNLISYAYDKRKADLTEQICHINWDKSLSVTSRGQSIRSAETACIHPGSLYCLCTQITIEPTEIKYNSASSDKGYKNFFPG